MRAHPARVLPAVVLGALAVPGTATAATLAPATDCVLSGSPFATQAAGLPPATRLRVRTSQGFDLPVTSGSDGSLVAPAVPTNAIGIGTASSRPLGVSVTDEAGTVLAAAALRVAIRNAFITPRLADARRTFTLTAQGMPTGQPVYAHLVLGERAVRTVLVGTAQGGCGRAVRATRIFSRLRQRSTSARVVLDTSRSWSDATRPQATLGLIVRRIVREARKPNYRVQVIARNYAA